MFIKNLPQTFTIAHLGKLCSTNYFKGMCASCNNDLQ